MGYRAVRVSVSDLNRARQYYENKAHQREQCSPRMTCTGCLAAIPHTNLLYRSGLDPSVGRNRTAPGPSPQNLLGPVSGFTLRLRFEW